MAVNQDNVSALLLVLSHELRREILQLIEDKGEQSFTDLKNALNVDTGKLCFHIRNLRLFLTQTPQGKYKLSVVGEMALRLIREAETLATECDVTNKPYNLPTATLAKRIYAFLIDVSLIFTVFMTTVLVADLFSLITLGGSVNLETNITFFPFLFWAYLTLLEGYAGQTFGKRILRLKVLRIDGKKISYEQSAIRNFGTCFLLPIDLLLGLRLKDKKFKRYLDKFTGTTVIDLRTSLPKN